MRKSLFAIGVFAILCDLTTLTPHWQSGLAMVVVAVILLPFEVTIGKEPIA